MYRVLIADDEMPALRFTRNIIQQFSSQFQVVDAVISGEAALKVLDTVDNSQINVLSQRTMHRICTAATNEEVSFAYRVAIPRQRFRWRNAFSTRWRSL